MKYREGLTSSPEKRCIYNVSLCYLRELHVEKYLTYQPDWALGLQCLPVDFSLQNLVGLRAISVIYHHDNVAVPKEGIVNVDTITVQ